MDRYYVNDGGEIEDGHRPGAYQTLDEVEICALLNRLSDAEAEAARLDALNRELAVDLKEWRIRFPVNDPTIARRMVEDRTRAESAAALATERAARESAEQLAVWAVRHGAYQSHDPEHVELFIDELYRPDGKLRSVHRDSTDTGILAALRLAMEGSSDGE